MLVRVFMRFQSVFFCGTLIFLAPTAQAQAPVPVKHVFDAVSIRPHDPKLPPGPIGPGPDGYRAIDEPLAAIILDAYFPRVSQARWPLKNLPAWGLSEHYDIVAKVSPADFAAWKEQTDNWNPATPNWILMEMLQSMLADRCKLVVHSVPWQADGYALVVGKHRPKLRPAAPDEKIPATAIRIPEDGRMVPFRDRNNPVLTFYQTSMASLAAELMTMSPMPVIDRTGLHGKFDFILPKRDVGGGPVVWDFESLGLQLEPIKIPTEDIVIDHIERPSAN